MSSDPFDAVMTQLPAGEVPQQRTVAIHTHGCKLNQSDSQTLARQFREAGYQVVEPSENADIVVLNTCTVTATADSKARQFLRAARRRNPNSVIVATGCYAQRAPAELEKMGAVSLVVGNTSKYDLAMSAHTALQDTAPQAVSVGQTRTGAAGRTRAMVKIQEGCDQVCAYCIVPKVRGRERSIPPENIIEEINRHAADGYREVALTGTQLGSYGFDMPGLNLVRLLQRLLVETGIERLRVSSLQAHEITEDLLDLWRDSRLMRHFHIPLQSGSDPILRRMRRKYDTARFKASVALVRSKYPDAGITTDLIVGFPGETAGFFAESRDLCKEMAFADIHVFPYSPRPGTSAFLFDEQVAEPEKRERMGEMLAMTAESHRRFRVSQLGKERLVLWEHSSKAGQWTGLTDNYIRVRTLSSADLGNQITTAMMKGLEAEWVVAEAIV